MIFLTAARRALTVSAAALAFSVSIPSAIAQATTLSGAGASFPKNLYAVYFDNIERELGIEVNYEAIGSGGGIRQFVADTVDFGGTDVPPKPDKVARMKKGMILVPTAGGAVALAYNLPGNPDVALTREQLAGIFLGTIANWQEIDPSLPDLSVKPVVRADGSGTTFIFTSHLAAISNDFAEKVGAGKAPSWQGNPMTGAKNEGVATVVERNPGAIGYVQDSYARNNKLTTAAIENRTGEFVKPTIENANQALVGVDFNEDFTVSGIDDPASGYPIVGITWLMLKEEYDDAETKDAILQAIEWILTEGQKLNNKNEYTSIPENVAKEAWENVKARLTEGG